MIIKSTFCFTFYRTELLFVVRSISRNNSRQWQVSHPLHHNLIMRVGSSHVRPTSADPWEESLMRKLISHSTSVMTRRSTIGRRGVLQTWGGPWAAVYPETLQVYRVEISW